MNKWLHKLTAFFTQDIFGFSPGYLFKRNIKVLLLQFVGLAITVLSNILLARLYGEQVYGQYALLSSWVSFLVVIALFGMDDSHLVNLPSLKIGGKKTGILNQLKWSLSVNALSIAGVITLSYLIVNFCRIPGLSERPRYFNYALIILFGLSLYNNFIYFLRGLNQILAGELVDKMLRPVLFLVFLAASWFLLKADPLKEVIFSSSTGLFCSCFLLLLLIRRFFKGFENKLPAEKRTFSISPNIRYVLLNMLYTLSIRADILVLGILSTAVEVGHYNVAVKFADVFSYPIAAINLSLPVLISTERHLKGEMAAPEMMYRISRNIFVQCLLLDIFFLATGSWLLSLYGKSFTEAFPVLCLFIVSNLISAAMGSADIYFIMHAQEKKVIYCRTFSLLTTILLALFLIPYHGILGAALASLSGNLIYCSLLQYLFYKKYGIAIHPFKKRI